MDVKMIDELIAACIDSEKRNQHAAADVSRDDLTEFFNRQAAARKRAADELQEQRRRMGVVEEESGSAAGTLDRLAMDASVIMSMGDSGVLNWCREDAATMMAQYDQALAENLTPELRSVVSRQRADILQSIEDLDRLLTSYGGPRS